MLRDLRAELKEIMEQRGLSQIAISRGLGVSAGLLSQWFSGQYKGDVAKIDDSIRGFLERQKERLIGSKRKFPFFAMTTVAKRGYEVLRICHLDCIMGLLYGEAGLGKTELIREYVKSNSDAILIEADLGYTARDVFHEICKKLKIDIRGSIHAHMEVIISALKDSGRLIIIDEAENLPIRALDLIRRIHDKAGVGIVLVGKPVLRDNITRNKVEYLQIASRISMASRLDALTNADTRDIIERAIDDSNGVWKEYYTQSRGNTRHLENLVFLSRRLSVVNKQPINHEIINRASQMLVI